MTALDIWKDSRSGPTGCLAGNLVLAHIQRAVKKNMVHEKGTTFSTEACIYVCRVCTTDHYLQTDQLHFCNMSKAQYENARKYGKRVVFLFISVIGRTIHYWEVPARVVGTSLAKLSPKPSSPSCFLRIYSKSGKGSFLLSSNIGKFHKEIVLSGKNAEHFDKPSKKNGRTLNAVLYVGKGAGRKRYEGIAQSTGRKKMEVALA